MADPTVNEHGDLIFERTAYFRLAWLKALLTGKLPAGDTFWIGNVGIALIFMPILILVGGILPAIMGMSSGATAANATAQLIVIIARGVLFVYLVALTFAMYQSSQRRTDLGPWGWFGVAFTALHAFGAFFI
ncbi:MAG: hypothetical protein ACPGVK_04535 [Halocynthiibacter sp.]